MFAITRVAASAIAVVALAAGCSNAGPAANPSEFATVTGSPVAVADEITALCEQVIAESLPVEAATALAEASGYATRIVSLDGEPQPATKDYREDRMSFDVEAGLVTGCVVG